MEQRHTTDQRFAVLLAMDRLCRDHRYDDVSVDMLCAEARISRATFYRTFENKYRIATWYQDLVLRASIGEIGRSCTWHDGLLMSYDGWLMAPTINSAARACMGYESVRDNCKRALQRYFQESIVIY